MRRDPSLTADSGADNELVRSARNGDRPSLEQLADRFTCVPRILTVLNRRLGSRLSTHDVEDLSQDVVLLAWENLAKLRPGMPLEGWLYRFCVYCMRNRLRKQIRRSVVRVGEVPDVALELEPYLALDRQHVLDLLSELDADEEAVVRLKHTRDLTFTEIGEQLQQPVSSVKTRYYRGIRALRQRLRTRDEEPGDE